MFSITTTPNTYEPVNSNSFYWQLFDTTVSAKTDYKYIENLYVSDNYTGSIYTLESNNRPYPETDGSSIYSPKVILRSNLNYNQGSTTYNNQNAISYLSQTNGFKWYKLEYGSEWTPNSGNTIQVTDILSGTTSGNAVLQFNNTTGDTVQVGDYVNFLKNNVFINEQYEGKHYIISASTTGATIDVPYGQYSAYPETGNITKIGRIYGITTPYGGWLGTRPFENRLIDYYANYTINSTGGRFLSVWNRNYSKPQYYLSGEYAQTERISFLLPINELNWSSNTGLRITYYTGTTTPAGTFDISMANNLRNGTALFNAPVGVSNLLSYGSVITPSTTNYEINFNYNNVSGFSETRKYHIVQKEYCQNNLVEVVFLNSLGGYDSWVFNLRVQENTSWSIKTINKGLKPNYQMGERDEQVYESDAYDDYTVFDSNLNDYEIDFLKELELSPEVYARNLEGSSTQYYPVTIIDTSFLTQRRRNNDKQEVTIKFKKAFKKLTNI